MDFKQELAQFRQSFAQREAQIKQEVRGDAVPADSMTPDAIWGDEIDMPTQGYGIPTPEAFAGDIEVPDVLTDRDDRWGDDDEMNSQAFQEYMANDPMMVEHGDAMEALLDEVIAQAQDPENPMTPEEAQQVLIEMMTEQFGRYFM